MSEFVNRMAAQRELVRAVNAVPWSEELFGLSNSAIQRWILANQLPSASPEVKLVLEAADALNFLATRSQEQISADYERVCADVADLTFRVQGQFLIFQRMTNSTSVRIGAR